MIATAKRCRKKFVYRYVRELAPARSYYAPSFGTLFHLLQYGLYKKGDEVNFLDLSHRWRQKKIEEAEKNFEQVKAKFGIEDEGIISTVKSDTLKLCEDCLDLVQYYKKSVWDKEKDRFKYVFLEQPFSVPLTTRDDRKHPTWRYDGKWDAIVLDKHTGRVVIRDIKTTTRTPSDFIDLTELDTQPIGYYYAGIWLAIMDRPQFTMAEMKNKVIPIQDTIYPDYPLWPSDLPKPSGFEVEVIRRKVPKKPQPVKKGNRLSKVVTDTTYDLYIEAIMENNFPVEEYKEILDRLQRKGPTFHLRQEVNIGPLEIERWAEETRMCLEDLRYLELHPERAYRADSMTCQSQYGKRCEYHPLCYGDEDMAIADFIHKPAHNELVETEE